MVIVADVKVPHHGPGVWKTRSERDRLRDSTYCYGIGQTSRDLSRPPNPRAGSGRDDRMTYQE